MGSLPLSNQGNPIYFIQIKNVNSVYGASQVVLVIKTPPANAGDARDKGLIPGSGKSSGWELGWQGSGERSCRGKTGPPEREGTWLQGSGKQAWRALAFVEHRIRATILPQPHCIPKQGEGLSITPIPLGSFRVKRSSPFLPVNIL